MILYLCHSSGHEDIFRISRKTKFHKILLEFLENMYMICHIIGCGVVTDFIVCQYREILYFAKFVNEIRNELQKTISRNFVSMNVISGISFVNFAKYYIKSYRTFA